jgi:geranyl diphosphate synthase
VDPYAMVHQEVGTVTERLRHSIASTVPTLGRAAEYFFQQGAEGKRLRPTMLLLMASALSPAAPAAHCLQVSRSVAQYLPVSALRCVQSLVLQSVLWEIVHVALPG